MRPREFMGEEDEHFVLTGTLFPVRYAQLIGQSGHAQLGTLDGMRASGQPQILVRGDGVNLGWWLVEHVRERHTVLSESGVGRVIEYTIHLVRSPITGSAAGLLSMLYSLAA